jgi:hypothetical protein
LAHNQNEPTSLQMAGLIIVPQMIAALLSPWVGYHSERFGQARPARLSARCDARDDPVAQNLRRQFVLGMRDLGCLEGRDYASIRAAKREPPAKYPS